jgi:hypothetical protein
MNNRTDAYVLELAWKEPELASDNVIFFDGIGFGSSTTLRDKRESSIPVHDFDMDMQGEWLAVSRDRKSIAVRTDHFGFFHLFYTTPELNGAGIAAASPSFEALLTYLRDRNCKPCPDISYALPLMASTSAFFNQGYSTRTSCIQVKRLLPGEVIRITAQGISVTSSEIWDQTPAADYHDLIDIGISKLRTQLESLNTNGIEKKELYLSGGKDSRACLALLLARRNRDFTCTTHGPEGKLGLVSDVLRRDFAIATELVSHYNLRWTEPMERHVEPKTFSECLFDYRRYRSNKYYSFKPQNFETRNNSGMYMEIHGGGGEALRGYWAKHFRSLPVSGKFKVTRGNVWHDASHIFRSLVQRQSIPEELYSQSLQDFVNDIRAIPGKNIYEVLDNHYILHRNRYHFGNLRHAYSVGKLLYYPLAQKEFLLAAQQLPHAVRSQGKLLHDIIQQSTPSAHLFAYESGFFDCAPPPLTHMPVTALAQQDVIKEFREIQEANALRAGKLYASGRNYDIQAAMRNLASKNIEKIMDGSKELRGIYEGQQVGRESKTLANTARNHYAARLDGIAQVFEPQQSYTLVSI